MDISSRPKVRGIFARFGAKPQAYNSFQVYRPQGKQAKDMAFVLFDGETILFGDAPSIFAALDRNQFGALALSQRRTPGSMVARAAEMEASYDFWVIMDATEMMSNDSVAALFRGGEWASEAQGFEAGVNLRAGLAADITVRFSSEATAKRMTTELTRVMNLAAKDKSTGAEVQDIAKKLKFNVDGSATKISLRLTQQEMEKSAQAFAASHKAASQAAAVSCQFRRRADSPTQLRPSPRSSGSRGWTMALARFPFTPHHKPALIGLPSTLVSAIWPKANDSWWKCAARAAKQRFRSTRSSKR